MANKVSVITVVYNDVKHIRETMESFFAQTWDEKEYIVIDGGSTDGTADIIREYADRLSYWCSEKDNGVYYAMNKGISHATGDWVNILNSGDLFADSHSLERIFSSVEPDRLEKADVVYGDSIERDGGSDIYQEAGSDIRGMENGPVFRHGCCLIRTEIQKDNLFDVSRLADYGFALDWLMLWRLYKEGCKFVKADATVQIFRTEGMSNNPALSMAYNIMIIHGRGLTWRDKLGIRKALLVKKLKLTGLYKVAVYFLTEYLLNSVLPTVPFWSWRRAYLKFVKMHVGKGAFVMKRNYILTPQRISIGSHSHVNRGCTLDGRGVIRIGNNVSISHGVMIMTGSHDGRSANFQARFLPVRIDDHAWIGAGATILQNVHVGEGAIVCAGAVVTHDVKPYDIVAGIPAKKIDERPRNLNYECNGYEPFT